ncbi:MAG: galactokinase [Veillonella caviae]|nr:galactokinase [Veillonella caviae]
MDNSIKAVGLTKEQLKERFITVFGESEKPIKYFFAPGRVNIIGEHQDYNGGHVFPAALTMGIWGAIRVNAPAEPGYKEIRTYSANITGLPEEGCGSDSAKTNDKYFDFTYLEELDWSNYFWGVLNYFEKQGYELPCLDVYFEGNLPEGAGLSSSASLLDLTVYMLMDVLDIPMDRTKVAEIAKDVEYNYIGVKVGIMDQFAISHGKKGHGVFLDCTNMTFEHVPVDFGDYQLVIMNTNHQRSLVGSVFNVRKAECDTALEDIRKHRDLVALSLGTLDDLDYVENEVNRRRAKHAITENLRVVEFIQALRSKDMDKIKEIINASHESLRLDYEVSGLELDKIVEIARAQEGCLASRMTGAGFGGCAIAIVEKAKLESFKDAVANEYEAVVKVRPDLYIADLGDGVREL